MTMDDAELQAELAELAQPKTQRQYTKREERIIAGFEDIQRFVEQQEHIPEHGEAKDIFERLYAVRLDRLRQLEECRELLEPFDHQGLLAAAPASSSGTNTADMNDAELLAALGDAEPSSEQNIRTLRHVRPRNEIHTTQDIANREPCRDFHRFKLLFKAIENDLKTGNRKTIGFGRDTRIHQGEFFIVDGQLAYVAEVGETFKITGGQPDARLRVVYGNATESNILLRSLQRALYKDDSGRRISDPDPGPLFAEHFEEDDQQTGTIYVLRSESENPYIAAHRELIHKIGVTRGKVQNRIANAAGQSTYLLADVEIVATYDLAGIDPVKLENLLHRVFAPAQIDLTIPDRFGKPVQPREWFLVPLNVIDEAIQRIRDGSITEVTYDPLSVQLRAIAS